MNSSGHVKKISDVYSRSDVSNQVRFSHERITLKSNCTQTEIGFNLNTLKIQYNLT